IPNGSFIDIGSKHQFLESTHAVRELVLQVRFDFAEGLTIAFGHENRIIAEAAGPTRRPDDGAVDLAGKRCGLTVGNGESKRASEVRAPVGRDELLQLVVNSGHGKIESSVGTAPPGRMDAWRAAKRLDLQP